MEQPIIVKYQWSADDFLQTNRYFRWHTFYPITRFGLHLVFAIFLVIGIAGLLAYPKANGTSLTADIGYIIAGVYWFVIRPFNFRWTIRRRYAKRPDKDSEVEWKFAVDKISVQSSLGYSEFRWEALNKVVRTPSGIMLYSPVPVAHYLPRRGFASDAEFEQLVELAKSKIKRFYRVA